MAVVTSEDSPATALRLWQEARRISNKELAAMLSVGVTAIARWRSGLAKPTLGPAVRLARITGGRIPVEAWSEQRLPMESEAEE